MKDHARQALKFFLNSQIFYIFHEFKAEFIISRLEQDEYYSLMKEIILLFTNTHHSINAVILLRFNLFQKCWMSLGSCLLCLMELYGLIVFHSQFILNLPRLRKGKGVWVFLTRFQNVAEVIRASQFHCDSMP